MKIFTQGIVFASTNHELSLGETRTNFDNHSKLNAPTTFGSSAQSEEFLSILESSGLTGHGGAHFPVARKIRSAMQSPAGGTVVANAAEGEPGSAKDAALWQFRPHLVIDGLLIVGQLIQAKRLVIWIHNDERASHRSIVEAIKERETEGSPVHIEILTMPPRYTSGENSSVIAGVRGQEIAPRYRLDKARPWGIGNPAILSHNSETLARIAMVRKYGVEAARYHLLTAIGMDRRTVVEASSSDTYGQVVTKIEGNPPTLFGGYGATWMPWDSVKHLQCDPATLRAAGLSFGAGIIGVLPDESCPIVETGRVLTWMAGQSARQCGPCFRGLADVAQRWDDFANKSISSEEYHTMLMRIGLIPGRGGCAHPDGTIRFARSAITFFSEEVENHLEGKCAFKHSLDFLPIPSGVNAS